MHFRFPMIHILDIILLDRILITSYPKKLESDRKLICKIEVCAYYIPDFESKDTFLCPKIFFIYNQRLKEHICKNIRVQFTFNLLTQLLEKLNHQDQEHRDGQSTCIYGLCYNYCKHNHEWFNH